MTKIVPLHKVLLVGGYQNAIHLSKEKYNEDDLIVAQSETQEEWYNVKQVLDPSELKTGYTMYILTKHEK